MLEILQFVFSGFWIFIGTLMLTVVVVRGITVLIVAGIALVTKGRVNITW